MLLVVDDHPSECIGLKKLVESAGVPTECRTAPDDALRFMRSAKPALVVLDHMMPRKTGLEVFAEMKADPVLSDVPVVFFSATEDGERQQALSMGAVGWLVKGSVGWRELYSTVKDHLPEGASPQDA